MAGLALVTLAAVWYFARQLNETGFDWGRFWGTFRQMDPYWLAASVVLVLGTYYGRALRWAVMIRPLRPNPSMWGLFVSTAIGFTAVVLLGRAGELVRPYLISVREKLSFSSQVAAWMLERIYDLLIVLLIFGAAMMEAQASGVTLGPTLAKVLQVAGTAVFAAALVCLLILYLFSRHGDTMKERFLGAVTFLPDAVRLKLEKIVHAFVEGTHSTRDATSTTLIILYTLLEWLIIVLSFYSVFKAFPATAGFGVAGVVIFLGFVAIGSALQLPGIGGGMQVAAVIVLTEFFGLPIETASSIAVALWAITFVAIVPFGLALAFHEGVRWSALRHLPEEVER